LDAATIDALEGAGADADEEEILASDEIQTELMKQQESLDSLAQDDGSLAAALRRFWPRDILPETEVE
jgi:hypothetical protein